MKTPSSEETEAHRSYYVILRVIHKRWKEEHKNKSEQLDLCNKLIMYLYLCLFGEWDGPYWGIRYGLVWLTNMDNDADKDN